MLCILYFIVQHYLYCFQFEYFWTRFDKRITQFAEEKFQRDGIDVKTGFKVVKVSDKAITMTHKDTGEVDVPYGMAVWSTGIGTRPIIMDFMKDIGQVFQYSFLNLWFSFFYHDSFSLLNIETRFNKRFVCIFMSLKSKD